MANKHVSIEPEFYPIERVLIAGPPTDVLPLADRAAAAGHKVALLMPDEETPPVDKAHRVIRAGEAIGEDDFDLALELHCVDLEGKADTLLYLEDALNEEIPILTLTMAISAGELTREMLIAERVIGISLLPPIEDCKLVELMGTLDTRAEAWRVAERFFESLGMGVARVSDSPGGVLVRTVCCLVNEAALALQERIASAEEIDRAMRLGVNYPAGPLAWGDRIGLDRVLVVMDGLHAEFKEERYRPTPYLKQLVRAGRFGVRAGEGFFKYGAATE